MSYGNDGGFRGGRGGRGRGGGGGGRGRFNDEPIDPESEQFRKLFVGGLSYETDEDGLKGHFGQWGEIVDCVVMRDPNTKKSRGFGFITYKESAELDEAQKNRPHHIDGRDTDTKRAMPRDGDASNHQTVTKMFIGGIKDDTTESHVRETFEEFGNIAKVELITDKNTGKAKGFCFLTFDDHDAVDKCVLKKRIDCNGRKVEVKKAVSKDQMSGSAGGGGRGGGRGGRNGPGGGFGNSNGGFGGGYGGGSGGYDNYGNGGGYGGGQNWGNSGGYGDYSNGGGGFGQNYGGGYGGGPVRGGGYSARGSGPYGGGYGAGGGDGGYGGGRGGGFRR